MTQIVAHRGASLDHPENTLAAFRGAREQGADGVELDVRRTSDSQLAISHDAHLSDGRLLREVEAGDLPEGVPLLDAALDVLEGLFVNIELKNIPTEADFDAGHTIAQLVVDHLATRAAIGEILISSFSLDVIDRVHELAPQLPTGWLIFDLADREQVLDLTVERGHSAFHPFANHVDQPLVDHAHERGLALNTWTVDEPDRIRALAEMGVDAIITNAPAIARAALEVQP